MKTKLCMVVLLFINFLECGKKKTETEDPRMTALSNQLYEMQKQIKELKRKKQFTEEKKAQLQEELNLINTKFAKIKIADDDAL